MHRIVTEQESREPQQAQLSGAFEFHDYLKPLLRKGFSL
jgi:hypothetical protein